MCCFGEAIYHKYIPSPMSDIPAGLAAALSDRYVLERQVGSGGMATVYLARDLITSVWSP